MRQETRTPGELPETMLEFARPLIGVLGPPQSIEELRNVMMLATLCWNLPILEREQASEAEQTRRSFEEAMARLPEPLPSTLRQLTEDRLGKFGSIPHYVLIEVRGDALDDAVIHAEARGFEA
jgi:hypothetical protein